MQWQKLCDDLSLVPDAVEEGLRFEPPLRSLMPQWPLRDTEIDGMTIRAGEKVALWIGAANRDPAVFDHPDEFDMHRKDNRHLAFSAGSHFCLGAALARLETRTALTELAVRFPKLTLIDDHPTWRPIVNNRALATLPVCWA
jgi:cytochrome P450